MQSSGRQVLVEMAKQGHFFAPTHHINQPHGETLGFAQAKEPKCNEATNVHLSVKTNGKVFLQRREKYGKIQTQFAEDMRLRGI